MFKMNPTFLNSNSTSHTRPFSAVAELIDNATDPGVSAKQIWIDVVEEDGQLCLTFTDNGSGMTPNKLHKMLSFGFTEKGSSKCIQQAIGIYGNGFKSGSMRLGRDALIFTKNGGCQSVGMLSQTYLESIKAQAVIVPIVPFREQTKSLVITEDSEASLAAILKHSIITSLECIHAHFDSITSKKGTKILIWNIRRAKDGNPEIDFETDVSDFRLPPIQREESKKSLRCSGFLKAEQSVPAIQYSLREYLSILYLKPRTQIILRGKKVMAKLLSKRLKCIERDVYKPHFNKEKVKMTFGISPKRKEHYGIMMYHKNRLIKSYEKVGCQLKASRQKAGVGVIGIIECNFLRPAHNKQDFEYTKEYRLTLSALGQKLNDYWKEVTKSRARERPPQTVDREESDDEHNEDQATMWLQCEECLKWRSVATKHYKTVPENWTCSQNYNPRYRSCSAPEETEDNAELSTPTYKKKHKKQDHPESRKQEEDEEDQEAKQIPSQCSSELSQPNRQARRALHHRRTEEEENTSDEDQEKACQQGDDDTNTPQKPLERTAINHKTQEQMLEESETNEHRLVNGEGGETEDTETEAMEEKEENIDISSLKRKLASLINSMGKKPRHQEEQDPDPRKMADEKNPDEQRNTPTTLSSDKTNQDKSSAAEKPGDIAQPITSNPSMANSLSSTQTVKVSLLSRKEGPCSMEESDPVANVQKLARLEKEAQRLRQLEGLEVTKTTQGTMTTAHCTRDVGCQTSLAESSTSSSSLALNPELQEMMSKTTKAETPSRMRASDSEALEDSRSSQERLRSIRSNMVVLLTALLPQLDLTGISLDTSDIDNILQQIIELHRCLQKVPIVKSSKDGEVLHFMKPSSVDNVVYKCRS